MKQLLIVSFIALSLHLTAQTKKIAFESHSGRPENFNVALENNWSDLENSNFGQGPEQTIRNAELDSVIFVSDSVAILVTSEFCKTVNRYSREQIEKQSLWSAGRQMVILHPLFSRQHCLDSIKQVIRQQYYFRNPVEKVIFVGYDNGQKEITKNNLSPVSVIPKDDGHSSFDGQLVLALSLLVLSFSILTAYLSYEYYRLRTKAKHSSLIPV